MWRILATLLESFVYLRKARMMEMSRIKISKKGITKVISLRRGLGFQALAAIQDTGFEFDCRKADCGICIFKVLEGAENLSSPTEAEADFLRAMHADPNERLACQCRVFGDVDLEIEF